MNIVELIRSENAGRLDRTAVAEGPRRVTYGELLAAVDAMAAALADAGIRPLDRVAFLCGDSLEHIVGSLAVLSLSAVVVPVSPSLMSDEVEDLVDRMDVRFLLFEKSAQVRPEAKPLAGGGACGPAFMIVRREARNAFPAAYCAMNPAFIRFSSGTTGTSKGILLSHESIAARTAAADRALQISGEDVVLWVLSMSFHFVVTILLFLRRGAAIVLCGQPPFPEAFAQALREHTATLLYASPFHYHVLSHSPAVVSSDLAGIRLAVSTAMKLSADIAGAFFDKFGFELAEAYGIIEVGLPFVNDARSTKRGSVGHALPDYALRIEGAGPDGVGRIMIRGPGMFDAYLSPWQARAEALQDGWFSTGDMGRLDADGFLFIVGREKNVINFAGMKIFPDEVEEAVNRHPAVKESAVYGVPHPQYGQLPVARVVLREGAAFDERDLRRFCFQHLAAHKVPKSFEPVAALEHTPSGKIRRPS